LKLIYNDKLKGLARQNRKAGNLSEVLLWQQIKGRKLFGLQWTRQKPILNYIVDFYCPKLKIVIEIDGYSHLDLSKDKKRQEEIEKLGISFIRVNDLEVKNNIEGVIEFIKLCIEEDNPLNPPLLSLSLPISIGG